MRVPPDASASEVRARAEAIRSRLPREGLFAGHEWRISPDPFPLGDLARQLESLGRVLLQFYRAVNLLYRKSVEGKQPEWVARLLDQGKPSALVELQRHPAFKNDVPRVIRPDLLITEHGLSVTELDSVPGGIGLTAWLNQVHSEPGSQVIGGPDGMLRGFEGIFGDAPKTHIVVSEEASTYRPEMQWLSSQIDQNRFTVRETDFAGFADGEALYRFFELFDLANVANSRQIFELAQNRRIRLTPPPKPIFEEKLLFALLWNRNLLPFWRQELGEGFLRRLQAHVPYTWVVDPSPLPAHAAIPELGVTDWHQLELLSQKERQLILKVSGFSPHAWGARGVFLGSDLSHSDWSSAIRQAVRAFDHSPYVLQRYHKPALVNACWFDYQNGAAVPMQGRARICPYYFVHGDGDSSRAHLGGVLATICPADKKIIHGMSEAIFAPCSS